MDQFPTACLTLKDHGAGVRRKVLSDEKIQNPELAVQTASPGIRMTNWFSTIGWVMPTSMVGTLRAFRCLPPARAIFYLPFGGTSLLRKESRSRPLGLV